MAELTITIRFLDDRFHGRGDGGVPEWPPSPMRLFQALLAAAKPRWTDAVAAAFRWLETQPPPIIRTPKCETGAVRLTYVPNNNSDSPGQLRTGKLIQPTLMLNEPMLQYRWAVSPDDHPYARRIADVARGVRALGWGIDLAIGHGQVGEASPPANRGRTEWLPAQPDGLAGTLLRTPRQGSLASLEQAYAESLARIAPDGTLNDNPGQVLYDRTAYHTEQSRPAVTFTLQRRDDPERSRALRPVQIKSLVGMLRDAASCKAVLDALGPNGRDVVDRVILGHPPDAPGPRLSFLPLPSVGHPHSDGRIRRVLLAEPFDGDGKLVRLLAELLHGKDLRPKNGDDDLGVRLVKIDGDDAVVRRYALRPMHVWASATPVLLPGYDQRRQDRGNHRKRLARAEQLVRKALQQAGVEQSASILVSRTPLIPGTSHAHDYHPRKKLANYPRYHVRLTFKRPFAGPLSIGAGRHAGFGVMASLD